MEERQGCKFIETEYGFVGYRLGDDIVHLQDLYIKPEFRNKKKAHRLADMVVKIAKDGGCNKLLTHVSLTDSVSNHENLKTILSYGFRMIKSTDNCLYFMKDI
jgi:ribosomal protein S18 acetylase RimI-like enzyme